MRQLWIEDSGWSKGKKKKGTHTRRRWAKLAASKAAGAFVAVCVYLRSVLFKVKVNYRDKASSSDVLASGSRRRGSQSEPVWHIGSHLPPAVMMETSTVWSALRRCLAANWAPHLYAIKSECRLRCSFPNVSAACSRLRSWMVTQTRPPISWLRFDNLSDWNVHLPL